MLTKRLTRNNSITSILFFLTTIQLAFGLITAGYDGDIILPNAASLPFLVLVGCAGLLAHFCLILSRSSLCAYLMRSHW